jgi:hypothetical protein
MTHLTNRAEVRELLCYARDGERVTGTELHRRREAMQRDNPARADEYRTASRSAKRWKREMRTASRTSMTLAELDGRLDALEETLGVDLR